MSDMKRIVTMGAGMSLMAAMALGAPSRGFADGPPSKSYKTRKASDAKKDARKRQKRARAVTRKKR